MSDMEIRKKILKSLDEVRLPTQRQSIMDSKMLTRLDVKEKSVFIELRIPEKSTTFEKSLEFQATKAVQSVDPDFQVAVAFISAQEEKEANKPPQIGTMIAIGSGKGGVGKSSVTVNLAMSLKALNYKVGILDLDVYGPSIPTMMGVEGKKPVVIDGKIQPIDSHGIALMSAGFFVEENQGLVWRGPMIHKLVNQFYNDVQWDGVDVLLVDLPPGTGDAPLSLAQTMPLNGALLVSLPQKVSIIDVRRAYAMMNQLKIPVFGLVENMSEYICPSCSHRESLFGEGQVEALAKEFGLPFLGQIPLEPKIRKLSDEGTPFVMKEGDSETAQSFHRIAKRMGGVIRLADQAAEPTEEMAI